MGTLARSVALISVLLLTLSLTITVQAHAEDDGTTVKWERIVGILAPGSIVGQHLDQTSCSDNVNCVGGFGRPWTAKDGRVRVDLLDGEVEIEIRGLVLASDPRPPGAVIGTAGNFRMVKGTLVCNDTGPGVSTLVDTAAFPFSAQRDADFRGTVSIPMECTDPSDMAFLIRVTPVFFNVTDPWIAHGAVRLVDDDDDKDKDDDEDSKGYPRRSWFR